MDQRFEALAQLAVHGANVQPGQVVAITANVGGHEEVARAIAAAAYDRGALYVDVYYFDPLLKRARAQHADPDTLEFVPAWLTDRLLSLAERGDARIGLNGVVHPEAMAGVDPVLAGRDQLPWLKETGRIISERATNWCAVATPNAAWAKLVYPELADGEAYERLWQDLWHVLRLDESDPAAAWNERADSLKRSAAAMTSHTFDAIELHGPGTELTIGLLPTSTWGAADFTTRTGIRHFPNLPTEEVFTSPDPLRTEGYVTATKPLVLLDGSIVRDLKVHFEGGRAVEFEGNENVGALRAKAAFDDGASRLGEVALVDGQGRIGPLGTVFYDTLLDENAASHIAIGSGFGFAVGDDADRERINKSGIHVDFMVGSPELEVDGVTADGTRVPVLRDGVWQI